MLDGQVPHVPGVRAMREQGLLLLWGGGQAVARHGAIVACTLEHRDENVLDSAWSTGIRPGGECRFLPCSAGVRFLPGLKAGVSSEVLR
ncbi:hypothetical protein GCM10010191_48490 [Actinomadura vinacea]|uniref:Uncharacterized protein n=1 Tax=Actinomadura vinacea TaxID=115336 RepID=A0ABN3JG83_9ACTN